MEKFYFTSFNYSFILTLTRNRMETSAKTSITVVTTVNAPVEKVWQFWTLPEHLTQWNHASDDWHTPHAENDARTGGRFKVRMEAKDGSMGFDFESVYDEVIPRQLITYSLGDGRNVKITFEATGNETHISETFDAESTHSDEMQRAGWQAILDNFKKYIEAN
jgi:uncharacterized protein YndB with AHSA1/START domain